MYTKKEIQNAQDAISRYTDASKFWSTDDGKKAIRISNDLGLRSQSTNQYRSMVFNESLAMEHLGFKD